MIETFFRESGSGVGVVCLHSNASSSSQWRALMEKLAPSFHVLAPDGFGAGKGPSWTAAGQLTLGDEVALLEPVFERAGDPFVLVGHSYGASVALVAAVQQPARVRALALYEPTLVSLVDAWSAPPNEADGIRLIVEKAVESLKRGDRATAAQLFTDYWMGEGSWLARSEAQRLSIEASVAHIKAWGNALFGEPTPLAAFGKLQMPVLLMIGSKTRVPARAVTRLLSQVLPNVRVVELDGLGHMGPITHADAVNDAIERFLRREASDAWESDGSG